MPKPDEIERIRELAEKATPAPWRIPGPHDYGDEHDIADARGDRVAGSFDNSGFVRSEDAALTVALRNAWPTLLARLESAREALEFYADPASWANVTQWDQRKIELGGFKLDAVLIHSPAMDDGGAKARSVLASLGKEEPHA